MRTLLRLLICLTCFLATGPALAQATQECPPLSRGAPIVERAPLNIDRLEGQVIFPVPAMPHVHGSLAGFCMAVFDAQSAGPVATALTGATGTFTFAGVPSGDYVLTGKHINGEGESLRLPVRLSNKLTGEALRGLLIRVDMEGSRQGAGGEVIGNMGLRETLLGMLATDQAVRMEMIDQGMDNIRPGLQDRMARIDAQTETRLAAIVREHGWPGIDMVGLDGSDAASVMLQHVGPGLQKESLPLVEAAFRAGKASGPNYAMLVDRVRLAEGRPQLYGTAAMPFTQAGEITFQPIEDETRVDARRAEVGLMPLEEYRQLMRQMYFPDRTTESGPAKVSE